MQNQMKQNCSVDHKQWNEETRGSEKGFSLISPSLSRVGATLDTWDFKEHT